MPRLNTAFKSNVNIACNRRLNDWAKLHIMNEQMIRLYEAAKEAAQAKGQSAVARELNKSPQVLKNWEARGISKEGLLDAQKRFGCAAEWLATGSGPKWVSTPQAQVKEGNAGYRLGQIQGWDDSTPLHDEDVEVPLYKEVELAAGSGTATHAVETTGRKLRFARSALRDAGVSQANAACARVTGNSMERAIMDGATVGIDRGKTQIKDGKVFAIDHGGMLRVKYLYRLPNGGIRLHSENDAEYPDEFYTAEQAAQDIKILGWVFWVSQISKW